MDDKNEMVELDGAQVFSDWNNLINGDKAQPAETKEDISLDNLMTDGGGDRWLREFQTTNLMDMDLVALKSIPAYVHDFKAEQAQLRVQANIFLLKLPTTHLNELRVAGLSDDQIDMLGRGILPINWTVHLKYPLAYGGVITPENLVLIPQHPFHENLHHFINQQIITDAGVMTPETLYVPVPKKNVYIPFGSNEMATEIIHFETTGVK